MSRLKRYRVVVLTSGSCTATTHWTKSSARAACEAAYATEDTSYWFYRRGTRRPVEWGATGPCPPLSLLASMGEPTARELV